MFRDYDIVKDLLRKHFYEITKLMEKRQLSYDEIKELLVSTLYDVSLEKQTIKEEIYIDKSMQVLYGPPRMSEVETMFVDGRSLEHGDEFVPGTNIYKPRERMVEESYEDYLQYLDEYYGAYFPDKGNRKAR